MKTKSLFPARRATHPNGSVPHSHPKHSLTPFFAEIDLYATGPDEPGRFSQLMQTPLRYGCWVQDARGTTHGGRFHFSMKVRGLHEHVEQLKIIAEDDPLFPKSRPTFTINRRPERIIKKCDRLEIFAEAANDVHIAKIPAYAGKRGINIAYMELRRIDAPFSGKVVAAEFLCSEIMFDVQSDQIGSFSFFKADLVELLDDDELIRLWGPIPEGHPGDRPAWKYDRHRI